jgi:hypothetical protein
MTVAGRLLHAQQEQGSALRIEAKAINAVHCGVAVPAQLVSALLVTGAEGLVEGARLLPDEARYAIFRRRVRRNGRHCILGPEPFSEHKSGDYRSAAI